MISMLTRYFFSLTQTQLVLAPIISALVATIATLIVGTHTVILIGYFFAVGYITLDFFYVQEKYRPMLNTMPIHVRDIVKMQCSYLFQVCILYGFIYISFFILYTAIRAEVSIILTLTAIFILIGGSLLFFNVLFILEYTLKSGAGIFLAIIMLFIMFGGYQSIIFLFKNLPSIVDYTTALFIFIMVMIGITFVNFRFIVRLYERRDFV